MYLLDDVYIRCIYRYVYVIRCAIWYQMLKNGVRMVGQNAVLTSQNAFEWLSQESVSLSPFACIQTLI